MRVGLNGKGRGLNGESPIRSLDGEVVDAGLANLHQPVGCEFPLFVAIGAVPLAGFVVVFVFEFHRDSIVSKTPQSLLEVVVQFAVPLALKKLANLCSAVEKDRAIAPSGVFGVGHRDFFWISGVPGVLGGLHFLSGRLEGEGWEWGFHDFEVVWGSPLSQQSLTGLLR